MAFPYGFEDFVITLLLSPVLLLIAVMAWHVVAAKLGGQ